NNPLFDTTKIIWKAPYTEANMMGGTPVTIDENGVLTCTPNQVGQYVIGIRVNEWRNGVKINSVIRDFQFNVRNCNSPIAAAPQKSGTIDPKTGIGFFEINCDDFTIKFTNTSQGANKYKWFFGEPSSGVNNMSTLPAPSHTYADTGTYLVTLLAINSDSSCADTFRTKVAIYPYFMVGYLSNNICEDSLAIFTDTSKHKYSIINKWEWNFGDNATSTLRNPVHKYADGGTYNVSLTVSTNKGCVKNVTKPITIYSDPTVNFNFPSPACERTTLTFVNTSSIPAPYSIASYQWDMGNGSMPTVASPSITYNVAGNKQIKLIAVSNKGCADTITKNLTINPLPVVDAIPDPTICWDGSAQLSATGAVTYKWTPGKTLNDSLIANPIATPNSFPTPIKYYVFGADINQCVNVDSVTVKYYNKPNVNAGLDTSVCLNPSPFVFRDSVRLTASGALTYTWTPTAGLSNANVFNPLSKPSQNTDYIVEGIDANNCKVKDTVRVIVLDPSLDLIPFTDTFLCENDSIELRVLDQGIITKYFWTPGSFLSNRDIRSPLFFPKDTTWFILNVQNYCYTKNDSVRLDVHLIPKLNLPDSDSICEGISYQINAIGNGNWRWNSDPSLSSLFIPNPIARPKFTTKYYVTVTDQFNCKNRDSILINVFYSPPLRILNKPKFVCKDIPFQIDVYSGNNCTFEWTPTNGVATPISKNPVITASDTTLYLVKATNEYGCIAKDSVLFRVQKPIIPVAKTPVQFCQLSFADLSADGGLYYKWRPNYNINDSTSNKPQVYPLNNFVYTVYISNDCFIDSAKVAVIIDTLQKINAGNDKTIIRGGSTSLEVTNAVGQVEWTPNYAIDNQYTFTPVVRPMKTTMYNVRLRDNRGCVTNDSVLVIVDGKTLLMLPTGFSPNADGVNDGFGIVRHSNIASLDYFNIYNRWGELVFSTDDINQRWDGTYKGDKAPLATYVWYVKANTYDGEKVLQSGNITLIK
ncbi:MAG: gliding motility-associated C-terminal domain-containing protein, partial [Chitinophagales bacterium]|nr:gliding motility-associated C-terminal domain-containing protein [Chitinophagales bacterium]